MPVPLREMVCGLAPPVSEIDTIALRLPVAVGLNLTVIVQLPPAGTLDPQVFDWVKSLGFVPFSAIPILNADVPTLVRVTVCAELIVPTFWLPKLRLVVERLTEVPVPVSATFCGLPPPLSVIDTEAARVPMARGAKLTLMAQLARAATLLPQVFVCVKSPLFVPVMATL